MNSGPEKTVTLREITADTLRDILRLQVADHQQAFVAPNAVSIAEAYFCPQAWFRAIYADDTPVGFVMLYIDHDKPEYYLWRFMIDQQHQGKGYGRRALEQVLVHIRQFPQAREVRVSYVPGEGNPSPFYAQVGFVETGEEDDGERVMFLTFPPT